MTLPFVTLNHYTPSGFQTQDVVLKEDAEKLGAENKRLKDIIARAYFGIREIKSQYICTRFEACETCHAAELAAKDKEISALKDTITSLRVHLSAVKVYVNDKIDFALGEKHD